MSERRTGSRHTGRQSLRFTRVRLENWRNFREAEVRLGKRAFLVGANASGKSNFLDALRFLRDIARPEGGLASALALPGRGSFKNVRCLFARKPSTLTIDVDVGDDTDPLVWSYTLVLQQHGAVRGDPVTVEREIVKHGDAVVLDERRPQQTEDWLLWTQTKLEQVQQNQKFRGLAEFFTSIRYLHVVPQIVRDARRSIVATEDPFGGDLLRRMKETPKKMREPRLKRMRDALQLAVPQFKDLELKDDVEGRPHLYAAFRHWRFHPTQQDETLLSDGTLRLLGFLWSITERGGPLLLEEPELSLHDAVVAQLPAMIAKAQRLSGRQVIASTHSEALLNAPGISPDEVHRITVSDNGSVIETAADNPVIRDQVEKAGWPLGQAVLPLTQPDGIDRLGSLSVVSD
jgi:predicted ATPase